MGAAPILLTRGISGLACTQYTVADPPAPRASGLGVGVGGYSALGSLPRAGALERGAGLLEAEARLLELVGGNSAAAPDLHCALEAWNGLVGAAACERQIRHADQHVGDLGDVGSDALADRQRLFQVGLSLVEGTAVEQHLTQALQRERRRRMLGPSRSQ